MIPGRTWQGRDEVKEFFRRAWADDPSRKSHFITNVECTPREAGSVAVDAYFLYTASGDRSSVIGWGCYADVVDTTAPDPVFARKSMTVTRAADVARRVGRVTGRLDGRVAVITGASSGIGAGTARRFVKEGCRVVVADVQLDAGSRLVDELGDAATFVACDVTREDDVAAAVDRAVERFGHLDVMFNNAGVIGATGPIARSAMADVDFTIAVILRGTFLGMKHAARVMEPRRSGVILTTSSPAGIVGGMGAHTYSACKAAVIGLTLSVAAELRPKGIRVNAIVPGAVVTAMTADIVVGDPNDLERATEVLQESALMGRPGIPDDIAAGALYLASDDAAFVTGSTLMVDGGITWAPGSSPYASGDFGEPGALLEAGRRSRTETTS